MPDCEDCGRSFATPEALLQHRKDRHGGAQPAAAAPQKPAQQRKPRSLRRRNRHPVAITIAALALVAVVGVYFVASPYLQGPPFPYITGESWIHVHPYLTIDIAGTNVTVPQGIGILAGGLEPVHTHDSSGLLHVELSSTDANSHNYTLGDFFTIWNYTAGKEGSAVEPTLNGKVLPVVFSSTDLLGFKTNSTYQVVLLVDGHPSTQWGSLNLEQLDYCSAANYGAPCCPTDCTTSSGPASDPSWDGGSAYPYGYGHTIVLEYVKVS